jgi:hypothetical protein
MSAEARGLNVRHRNTRCHDFDELMRLPARSRLADGVDLAPTVPEHTLRMWIDNA